MADADDAALKAVRDRIDAIDRELLRLFNERAECAQQVAEIKMAALSDDSDAPVFYRPEREAQILARVRAENTGPMPDDDVVRLFRELISLCLSLEQPLSVAYLGPVGTYTEAAAIKHFGHAVQARPVSAIDDIFREVESGNAHYGVVPVENSTEGMVNHTLDCLLDSTVKIIGEVELPIHHCLLAAQGTEAAQIRVIYSHPQSLAQCRQYLAAEYPRAQRIAVSSNAEAARLAAAESGAAAIAGAMAAEHYELNVLASSIEDHVGNKTRFLVIGRELVGPSGRDKTSILVSTKNEPGALFRVLEPFHRHGISLTRLETRPARTGTWSYVFFIDFDGHQDNEDIRQVLDEVRQVAIDLKSLGSYPQASL